MLASGLCFLVTGYVGGWWIAAPAPADTHQRGTQITDGRRAQRQAARQRRRDGTVLTLAGVAIPPADETKHFKLIGTTGAGKSTAIREVLRTALERGDRAIIADPDGGYLERFYDRYRGDVILNPFDARSVRWDPFAEVRAPYDIQQLASSLIPLGEDGSGREWRGYARTFVSALLTRCQRTGTRDLAQLWYWLTTAPAAELRPLLTGTPAQPFLEADNARMFGSVRSVTTSALGALEHISHQRAAPFSICDWTGAAHGSTAHGRPPDPCHRAVLFLPYTAGQIAALRTLIATWLRLAIFEAMNQPERDERLWFVIDELDALGAIEGLKDALARLRKFGGRCVVGFQSIGQISALYGRGDAQTIVENCSNTLILRCSASEGGGTAQFASHLIGQREVLRPHESRTDSREGVILKGPNRRSTTVSHQHVTEWAVLPAELQQLPDLTGYLKLASRSNWLRVGLRPASPPAGERSRR